MILSDQRQGMFSRINCVPQICFAKNASQDVNSLYVILESVKQTGGDGGTQEVLIRNEREEDGYGDMMKTSDEPPEYSG